MNARTRHSIVHLLAAVFVSGGVVGCDHSQNAFTGPEVGSRQFSTVEGRVESTNQTASSDISSVTAANTASSGAAAADASTVAVAHVRTDGSLEVLAEAEVAADGRFSVDDVPAGRSDLVVVARTDGGAEVGRVLVHGETEADAVVITAPVNAETTVEGHVFATLKEAGVPEQIRSTAQVALLVHMSESTAAEVAASAQAIQEVSDGVRTSVEAKNRTFAELGADVDGQARAEAMLQAAAEHALSRHGGAEVEAANEAFLQAGVDALIQAGADTEEASLATTAAATGLDRAMAQANENARLEIAKNAVEMNLQARQRLMAEEPDNPASRIGAEAQTRARADVEAAASLSAVAQALLDAEASFEEELRTTILSSLSDASSDVRIRVDARLETAFAEADFSAQAQAAVSVDEIARAVVDYRQQLQTAVQAFVDSLPNDSSVSARVSTELLVAIHGGPSLNGGGS